MRTKYFKITRPEEYWWTPSYIKVAELDNDSTELNIFPGSIDYTEKTGDDFDERVALIYDRKMSREKVIEIDRDEFDKNYIKIVNEINLLSAL